MYQALSYLQFDFQYDTNRNLQKWNLLDFQLLFLLFGSIYITIYVSKWFRSALERQTDSTGKNE